MCHTTRRRQPEEIHGKDYNFVSIDEFEELIKLGCFVQTNMYNGQWYGLSIDSIEAVAAEGLATVVNMELEVCQCHKPRAWMSYFCVRPLRMFMTAFCEDMAN